MTEKKKDFWFPAKTYGWGWDLPICWQGWVVLAVYFILLVAGILIAWPESSSATIGLTAYVILLSLALGIICWIKGEKPKWRWGKSTKAD